MNTPISAPIRFILARLATGAALATVLLAALLLLDPALSRRLMAVALDRPLLLPALWLGAVAPLAVGFLATAFCLLDDPAGGGRGLRSAVPLPLRHGPVRPEQSRG